MTKSKTRLIKTIDFLLIFMCTIIFKTVIYIGNLNIKRAKSDERLNQNIVPTPISVELTRYNLNIIIIFNIFKYITYKTKYVY